MHHVLRGLVLIALLITSTRTGPALESRSAEVTFVFILQGSSSSALLPAATFTGAMWTSSSTYGRSIGSQLSGRIIGCGSL